MSFSIRVKGLTPHTGPEWVDLGQADPIKRQTGERFRL